MHFKFNEPEKARTVSIFLNPVICNSQCIRCTQRNIFEILLNQPGISLYIPFLINQTRNPIPIDSNQSGNGKYNLISVLFNNISKIFPCTWLVRPGRYRTVDSFFFLLFSAATFSQTK